MQEVQKHSFQNWNSWQRQLLSGQSPTFLLTLEHHLQPSGPEHLTDHKRRKNFEGLAYPVLADINSWLSYIHLTFLGSILPVDKIRAFFCPVASFPQLKQLHVEVLKVITVFKIEWEYCQEQTCLIVKRSFNNEIILLAIFCGSLMLLKTIYLYIA